MGSAVSFGGRTIHGGLRMDLSYKQEQFCLEYAKTGDGRGAYRKAGYASKTDGSMDSCISRLLKNVKVRARLDELRKEVERPAIADIAESQELLTKIIREEIFEDQVVTELTGEGCSEARIIRKRPSTNDRIKAVNTLVRMQGGFNDRVSVDLPTIIRDDIE